MTSPGDPSTSTSAGPAGARPAPPAGGPTDQVLRLLDAAIAETHRLGRNDLAERLVAERAQYTGGAWHVLVAGEFKKGKSSLVNALLGARVCGAHAVSFTAVPTIVEYGDALSAELVVGGTEESEQRRRRIDARAAADYTLRGRDDDGGQIQAVRLTVSRQLLRTGLVLIDTPGLGGGFAAAHAAATIRAMSLADAVLMVSDASQEYTAAEVEFLRRAAGLSSHLMCLLTKIDLYPEWQRILEINRGHLRRAGLDVEILPVSSVLRSVALRQNDQELNAESGFPAVVSRLRAQLARQRAEVWGARATAAAQSTLRQIAGTLDAEYSALARPAEQPVAMERLGVAQRSAERLSNPGARWLHTLTDRFADISSRIDEDLQSRMRRLEQEATRRIKTGDPAAEWSGFVPWLYQRTNDELTDSHARVLVQVNEVAEEIAAMFNSEASGLGRITGSAGSPAAGDAFQLDPLNVRSAGKLELGMQAARGWSLSSSVVTTLLVATLHPGLLVVLPITAVLGTIFAVKTVRGYRTARLEAARNEATRAVAGYLHRARVDAARAYQDVLRHSRSKIRDYYLDRASELTKTAAEERRATARAAEANTGEAIRRMSETAAELTRVRSLLAAADRLGSVPGPAKPTRPAR